MSGVAPAELVLVNPPSPDRVERYDHAAYPHLGLAILAAIARREGVSVAVVDAKLEGLGPSETARRILALRPRIVGLTAMTPEVKDGHDLALILRREMPQVTTIVGGVHATALPREVLEEFPAFDLAVHGEGEHTLTDLLRAFRAGADLRTGVELNGIPGLTLRGRDSLLVRPPRPFERNLDLFPDPDYSLFPAGREYPLMTQRGCPHACSFCFSQNGRLIRYRSLDRVVAEVTRLVADHAPPPPRRLAVEVYDETFGFDRGRTVELCRRLVEAGLAERIRWTAQMRVDVCDEELFHLMKAAGMWQVELGIESADDRTLRRVSKGITAARVEQAVTAARRAGLRTFGFLILGLPGENEAVIRRTLRFVSNLGLDAISLPILTPFPGTEIARLAAGGKAGLRLLSADWRDYNPHIGHAMEVEGLPRDRLERLQLEGYLTHFLARGRLVALLRFAFRYRREGLGFLRKVILGKWMRRRRASAPAAAARRLGDGEIG